MRYLQAWFLFAELEIGGLVVNVTGHKSDSDFVSE